MAFNIWRSLHQSFHQKVEHFNISEGGMLKLESKSTKDQNDSFVRDGECNNIFAINRFIVR